MIMSIVATALTPAAMTTVRCHPLFDLPLDVGCTYDVVEGIGIVVHDMICVDVSEAVCVDVKTIFVSVGKSVQEVAEGSYAGIPSNDPAKHYNKQ